MIELKITLNGDEHLYEQIYNYIKNEIKKGKLLRGERLPSTRSLAGFLNVSRTTVDMAYDQLLSEGYIEARPQRGYFICDVGQIVSVGNSVNSTNTTPNKHINKSEVDVERAESDKKIEIDFSPRAIDMSTFPYATWKKITRNILVDARSDMFKTGDAAGDMELRETIARYLMFARGVKCRAEQIVVGAGNDYLLMLLEKIIGHRNVAMEQLTYIKAYKIFKSFGYKVNIIGIDDNAISVNELKSTDSNLVYAMPSHQYPTGIVMPISRRMELLQWADESEERYIIEDDYDSEFRYRGKPVPSLQETDAKDKVIYIGTFSKSIAPSIRVSYMVLPYRLLEMYHEKCSCYSSTVSRIDQAILNEFIRDGYFERHLNKMRRLYRMKHDLLLEQLEGFEDRFDILGSDAGLHVILSAKKNNVSEEQLTKSAADAGVRVYPLKDYALMDGEKHIIASNLMRPTVIIGYASLSTEQIIEGCKRLNKIWK